MTLNNKNRFQDFFEKAEYIALKNLLYNYNLRKKAVEKILTQESHEIILEVGSGISPIMKKTNNIVYAELSFIACRTLKHNNKKGLYIVADATKLPFRSGSFSHIVCSEVLEHIEEDRLALSEFSRILKLGGRLVLTFPHRKCYFANDDRYVKHFRRYELPEIQQVLNEYSLQSLLVLKVLGPLEKAIQMIAVVIFEATLRFPFRSEKKSTFSRLLRWSEIPFARANQILTLIVRLDAFIMPRALAACLLIKAKKV
jgi:ubiquinone/menaquinone biosynthesis C-methylase UbiE